MKTKTSIAFPISGMIPSLTVQKTGDVKVVNAVASIHKVLDEIAPSGFIPCKMLSGNNHVQFVFEQDGVEAIFLVRKGGVR